METRTCPGKIPVSLNHDRHCYFRAATLGPADSVGVYPCPTAGKRQRGRDAAEALEIANAHAAKVSSLNQELESLTMKSELAKFRALEELWSEHKMLLEHEVNVHLAYQQRVDGDSGPEREP
jgi:hypothetical protein